MAQAIPTITRVQDAHDVSVTLGAGVDEYALCWDNDTARFVLRATTGYDHGLLNAASLLDDDHTQYLLATGARAGASAAAQPFTVGISLTDTTTSTTGVVFKGSTRFIHNFHHPTGGTAIPTGRNMFIGEGAGNFTTGSTATSVNHASHNSGLGYGVLAALTTGSNNMAVGSTALTSVTTGGSNTGMGFGALYNDTTGSNNVAIGTNTARYQSDGTTALTTPANSIYIGSGARGKDNLDSNSIVIGYIAIGLGANTIVLGNTSHTLTRLYGKIGNVDAPGAQVHVDQSSATGAIPVLLLDQGDDDQDMIEFTGTVGVGNCIEAVGAKTLTTTHFIKVTITGVGERYIPVGTIA